ncbi:GDP-mannose 4,6-dehydratase [Chloroflexota bacterium]
MIKKAIRASSCSIYGNISAFSTEEDMIPYPLSSYTTGKLTRKYYSQVYHHTYLFPKVFLRHFNVYEPKQNPSFDCSAANPRFSKVIFQGEPPITCHDGEQTEDCFFDKDVTITNILSTEGKAYSTLNIINEENITAYQSSEPERALNIANSAFLKQEYLAIIQNTI